MGSQVFISYSHHDSSDMRFVRSIIRLIRVGIEGPTIDISLYSDGPSTGRGIPIMGLFTLSPWADEDIPYGSDWSESISDAIKESVAVVVLVPDVQSSQVGIECGIASSHNKRILPLTRDPSHLAHYNLGRYQALSWPRNEEAWINRFATALQQLAKASLSEPHP